METVSNVYNDFIDSDKMQDLLDTIKREFANAPSAKELRDNEQLKKDFRKDVKGILDKVESLPDVKLKRAIDL
jgi:hypothetical protein